MRHCYDMRRIFKEEGESDHEETLSRISELMRNLDTCAENETLRSNKMELCKLMFTVLADDAKELRKR